MSLGLAITEYVKQLHSMTAVCERPRPDGSKCLQCYERANVIRSLEYILQTEEPRAYEALMAVTEETVHRK
jgi:hypothetical protein